MKTVFERSVFLPDLHVPYHDEKVFECWLRFVKKFKPNVVFLMGDWVDCYQLSKFDKKPSRIIELQDDFDATVSHIRRVRQVAPKAKFYYIKGNHEQRLTRFLWSSAAALASLRSLTIPEQLHLKEYDIEYVESGKMLFHGMIVKHGNVVRTKSGYSATGELEKNWRSGVSGHTHRLAQVFRSNEGGYYTWMELGCGCKLDAEYLEGQVADWQHGLGFGYFLKGDENFIVHIAPIIKGRLIFNGQFV